MIPLEELKKFVNLLDEDTLLKLADYVEDALVVKVEEKNLHKEIHFTVPTTSNYLDPVNYGHPYQSPICLDSELELLNKYFWSMDPLNRLNVVDAIKNLDYVKADYLIVKNAHLNLGVSSKFDYNQFYSGYYDPLAEPPGELQTADLILIIRKTLGI